MNNTPASEKVRLRLKSLMSEKELSVAELIRRDGSIRQSTVSDFMTGRNKTMTIETLDKLCRAMGITLHEFFDEGMFE